ncbi:MAG: hypothetical protein HW421_1612 [Ignavibacteria bacterium]|nr:hypothetical protein [Ignavibacteria bacterium]
MELIGGFIFAFLLSIHCIGMCGPIALAVPAVGKSGIDKLSDGALYSFGRIITYTLLGALFGSIGAAFRIAGLQESLSIAAGIFLLAMIFFNPQGTNTFLNKFPLTAAFNTRFQRLFRKILNRGKRGTLLIIGLLNGLLPCGLVYSGLTYALAQADPFRSALYMFGFGLGTTPAMLGIFLSKEFIPMRSRLKLVKIIPYGLALMGILLILRGLSLGIPYISPIIQNMNATGHCH